MPCSCSGSCGDCPGCGKTLSLTTPEIEILQTLGQFAFLPVARKADDMTPIYLEETLYTKEEYSIIFQLLEKKSLIDIDYSKPLRGFDMSAYKGYPVHGSVALTARGQQVLTLLDTQGLSEE